ncbi:competence protein ComEC [Bacillus pacificus]
MIQTKKTFRTRQQVSHITEEEKAIAIPIINEIAT